MVQKLIKLIRSGAASALRSVRKDVRYQWVLIIFAGVIFYNTIIVPDVANQKVASKQSVANDEMYDLPDLDRERKQVLYPNVMQGIDGDYYRVFVRANSLNDETIFVFAYVQSGERQLIGTLDLPAGKWAEEELMVRLDDVYDSIMVERADVASAQGWYENKIILDDPEIARLDVQNDFAFRNLGATIINTPEMRETLIASGESSIALSEKKQQYCTAFVAQNQYVSAVMMRLRYVGDGGSGAYAVTVEQRIPGTNEVRVIAHEVLKLTNLATYIAEGDNELYRVSLPTHLQVGDEYFVCMDNRDAKVSQDQHLVMNQLHDDEGGGLFALEYVVAPHDDMLLGARLEDRGSLYYLQYQFSGEEFEVFNVSSTDGDQPEYSVKKRTVFVPNRQGAFMEYVIRAPHAFDAVHGYTQLKDGDASDYTVLYSYDHELWTEVENMHANSGAYEFLIKPEGAAQDVYVRIRSKRDNQDVKGKIEIANLRLSVYMNKL